MNTRLPRSFRLYLVAITTLGAGILLWSLTTISSLVWPGALLWVGLLLLPALFLAPTLRGGSVVTVSPAIGYAAIFIHGPGVAAILMAAQAAATDVFVRKVAGYKVVFNAGQRALATGLAGAVYMALGGVPGESAANSILNRGPELLLPIVACHITYFLLNTGSVAVAASLLNRGTSATQLWRTNYLWMVPESLATPVVGFSFALLYTLGEIGVLLLFFFWLMWETQPARAMVMLQQSRGNAIATLASTQGLSLPHLKTESQRIAKLAVLIARKIGLPERSIETIETAGLFLNIGYIGIDHKILLSERPLERYEMEEVRKHPMIGEKIIRNVRSLRSVASIVGRHHEQPDGCGYPRRLKGRGIKAEAGIVRVAEAFQSMVSQRPYGKSRSIIEAMDELVAGEGTLFDSGAVDAISELAADGTLESLYGPGDEGREAAEAPSTPPPSTRETEPQPQVVGQPAAARSELHHAGSGSSTT